MAAEAALQTGEVGSQLPGPANVNAKVKHSGVQLAPGL